MVRLLVFDLEGRETLVVGSSGGLWGACKSKESWPLEVRGLDGIEYCFSLIGLMC